MTLQAWNWNKQKKETAKAFEAFCVYRNMGLERTLEKTADELNKNISLINKWSSKFEWIERTSAYDEYLEEKKLEQQEKEISKMNERHIQESLALQKKALLKLQKLDPGDASVNEMLRMFEMGAKLERTARGATEAKVEVKHSGEMDIKHGINDELIKNPDARKKLRELFRINQSGSSMGKPGES